MRKIILLSFLLILVVWFAYFIKFGTGGAISSSTEVWGQFGDYIGGVINPLLSFVTIILLIHSLSEQQVANKSLMKETKRQERLEEFRKFETRFFNLIEMQRNGFESFAIEYQAIELVKVSGARAASYIEKTVMTLVDDGYTKAEIKIRIEQLDPNDHLYSLFRRFYLIVKLIDEKLSIDQREEYYEALVNLSEMKLICMVCMLASFFDWESVRHIRNSGILDKNGLREYMAFFQDS